MQNVFVSVVFRQDGLYFCLKFLRISLYLQVIAGFMFGFRRPLFTVISNMLAYVLQIVVQRLFRRVTYEQLSDVRTWTVDWPAVGRIV